MPINVIPNGIEAPQIQGPMDLYAKGVQLKSLLGQNQMQDMQIQNMKQQEADGQAQTKALHEWDGSNLNALPHLVLKNGGSSNAVFATVKHIGDQLKDAGQQTELDLKNNASKTDLLLGHIKSALELDDEHLQQGVISTVKADAQQGLVDPQHAQAMIQAALSTNNPKQIRDGVSIISKSLMGQKLIFDQTMKEREVAANEAKDNKPTKEMLAVSAAGGDKQAQAALDALAPADKNPTEASLALKAAGGDPEKALKRLDQSKREARPVINNMTGNDAKDIAKAIESGDQPPTLTGLYRNAGPVRAQLARDGYPLAQAESDWKATQKHLSTLNGAQQERLRQAITFTRSSVDVINKLYDEWKQVGPNSGFKIFNKGALVAAANTPGHAGEVATALIAQINDLTSELGTVYKGGNSSTDETLKLAGSNLKAEWNEQTFKRAVGLIGTNLDLRYNSIKHSEVAGASANNPYAPKQAPDAAPAAATKTLSMSAVQKAAKDHGVSVDAAKRDAEAAGYTVQ